MTEVRAHREAVAVLAAEHDAHIVLADDQKRPCWLERGPYSWQRRRPPPNVIRAHRGGFGIVPWSIKMTGMDVDEGDPLQLSIFVQPIASLRTRRGVHFYCADTLGRPNSQFHVHGCRGDVRGARGYLVLHYDGAERLLDAIRRCDDWHPSDLFALVGLPSIPLPPSHRECRRLEKVGSQVTGVTLTLAEARPNCRRNVLHRYLLDVADRTNRPRWSSGGPVDVRAWNAVVLELAVDALERMPRPRLPIYEVRRLAYAVSNWSASAPKGDHSPDTQRWRSKRLAERRTEAAKARYAAIRQAAAGGAGVHELAAAFQVSRWTVQRALR